MIALNATSNALKSTNESPATASEATLTELRAEIERVDATIIAAIQERMSLSRAAGRVKASNALPVTDPAREAAVVSRASALARAAGLPEDEIRALYWRIMAISRRAQLDVQAEVRVGPS